MPSPRHKNAKPERAKEDEGASLLDTVVVIGSDSTDSSSTRSVTGAAAKRSVEELLAEQRTDLEHGLSSNEVIRRRLPYGFNEFSVAQEDSLFSKFLGQFQDPLIMLLLGSAFVSVLMGHLEDALSITLAIVIVVTVAFVQEYRSEKSIEELNKLVPPMCHCIRDRRLTQMEARELVPGDIVCLNVGDRVPADCRLCEAVDLHVDESSLTGETHPVEKNTEVVFIEEEDIPIAERKNIVFMGTLVVGGRGKAVVMGTGEKSEFGAVFHMMQEVGERKTPLQLKMDKLGKHLSTFSFAVIGFIVLVGLVRGQPLVKLFTIGVSLAVAAIPEGLPICVTVTLALGVIRMAKRNAIVKKLPAVEALGCASVVCVDKTGTLTQNEMTVTEIYLPCEESILRVSGVGYHANGRISVGQSESGGRPGTPITGADHPQLQQLLEIGVLCNRAHFDGEKLLGQPTEGSLLVCARKGGFSGDYREKFEVVDEIPFSSDRKWMAVCCARKGGSNGGTKKWCIKGMLEGILPRCSSYIGKTASFTSGQCTPVPLTPHHRKAIEDAAHQMASRGLRVLALAWSNASHATLPPSGLSTPSTLLDSGLILAGLVGIIDPPRPGVAESVALMAACGVRTVMITGDSKDTAIAIGQSLGIFSPGVHNALSGAQLDASSLSDLENLISTATVFYRTTPRHKLTIVRALQAAGDVVAMTGDGVNDAPALKASDIGIAMGKTGTDVSKEAAHMILVDDNFSTLLSAMEEGKSIYYNIKNFLRFQLSTSVAALSLITLSTSLGMPNPLNAMQILWINIIMDGPPAQSLGVEPVDHDVMKQPPRLKDESMVTKSLIQRVVVAAFMIVCGTLYIFLRELEDGQISKRDTTMTFTTFVLFDMFNALSCRSESKSVFKIGIFSNKHFCYAVAGSLIGQLLVIYFPPLQKVFQTESLYLSDLIVIVCLGSTVLFVDEMRKLRARVAPSRGQHKPKRSRDFAAAEAFSNSV